MRNSFSSRILLKIRFISSPNRFSGCDPKTDALKLMMEAKNLDLNICGISFDNDSGAFETEDYKTMLVTTRTLFDYGKGILGLNLDTICLGGGLPATIDAETFSHFSAVISKIVMEFFPDPAIRVIAEPGQFIVGPSMTLFCTVQARKEVLNGNGDIEQMIYYLNHGFTGHFPSPKAIESETQGDNKVYPSVIMGSTGESHQKCEEELPFQFVGDVLYFENCGGDELISSSNSGGFRAPTVKYYLKQSCKIIL